MDKTIYMLSPSPGSRIPKFANAVDVRGAALSDDHLPDRVFLETPSGVEMLDRLLTSGNDLILSNTAADVLHDFNLDPDLVRCPMVKNSSSSQVEHAGYQLWRSVVQHNIMHASAETRQFKGNILSVYEWIVDKERVPDFDVFLGPINKWFVSDKVVEAVFKQRLTGFGFMLIPVL